MEKKFITDGIAVAIAAAVLLLIVLKMTGISSKTNNARGQIQSGSLDVKGGRLAPGWGCLDR